MSELSSNQDLDLSLLNEIADGSDEFMVETIDMFLQQTPELLVTINKNLEDKDWATAALSAHKLKPTLGFFGMLNTQALIQDIEMDCKSAEPNPGELQSKLAQVNDYINENIATLTQLKAEAQGRL